MVSLVYGLFQIILWGSLLAIAVAASFLHWPGWIVVFLITLFAWIVGKLTK